MRFTMLANCLVAIVLTAISSSSSLFAETLYGVTEQRFLVSWDSAAPNVLITGTAITGLQTNELIMGLDFRPATGELFALGSMGQLYTLDRNTAVATTVGAGFPTLNGSAFGFDFNPVIDRIRVVSDTDNNYVVNPNDGTITEVTSLFYSAGDPNVAENPNVVHSAYTNNFLGASSTQLYGIDTGLDALVTQANSAGTLGTVGSLGIDLTIRGGFDISGSSGLAYLVAETEGSAQSTFYTVDLNTGAASLIGQIGGGNVITALAVVPEPSSMMLALIGTIWLPRWSKQLQ